MPPLNLDTMPEWDARVTVRGVELRLRHPDNQGEASAAAKPGAVVRLLRWLFGDPKSIETDAIRNLALAVTQPQDHAFVRQLNGGELFRLVFGYQQIHEQWARDLAASYHALIAASRAPRTTPQTAAQRPTDTPEPGGRRRVVPTRIGHDTQPPSILQGLGKHERTNA